VGLKKMSGSLSGAKDSIDLDCFDPDCFIVEKQRSGEGGSSQRQGMLQRLRNNDPGSPTLELPHDAWAYMFAPGGGFVGSELEGALAHSSMVKALSISLPRRPFKGRTLGADVRKTLEGLRGCTLPLWLDWGERTDCDAASCLDGAVHGGSTVPAGSAAGGGDDDCASPLQVCGIKLGSTGLGPEGLEALLALELPHLARLELHFNPLGPACGRLLIDLLERNRQLELVLDDGQMQHLERYEEEANRSKLLAFGMGFHPRLGESSLIRMLGHVRGDKDDGTVYDVPLLMAIAAHVFQPAYRARIFKRNIVARAATRPVPASDIGIFGEHRGGCGVELLQDSKALQHASAHDAARIIAALLPSGSPAMSGLVLADSAPVIDTGGRAALMAFIDELRLARDPRVGRHFHLLFIMFISFIVCILLTISVTCCGLHIRVLRRFVTRLYSV